MSLLLASCGVPDASPVACLPSPAETPVVTPAATPIPRATGKPRPAAPVSAGTGTKATPRPTATPSPVAMASPAVPTAAEIVAGLRRLWEGTQTMKSRVTSWETDGKTERTQEVDAEVAKPDRMWANILKGSDGATIGTQVYWNGGTTCRIQTKFFGLPLKLTLPIADSRLKSLRGWTLADMSVARIFKALLADKAPITYVGQAMFGEQKVDVLELETPAVVPGITKEHLGVSLDHKTLLVREFYVGDTVVSRSHYADQAYNVPLPPEHWNF